jgi:hypothetical protein
MYVCEFTWEASSMSEKLELKRGGTAPDTSVKGDMPRADTSTPPADTMTVQA